MDSNRFHLCDPACPYCSGPNSNDCLSCFSVDTNPELLFLYNKKCVNECPKGSYTLYQSEWLLLSCKKEQDIENYIMVDTNCFPIVEYSENKIIFNIEEIEYGEKMSWLWQGNYIWTI